MTEARERTDGGRLARDYLRELLGRREKQRAGAPELAELFRGHERLPPTEFHESSFLYLRSYDGDLGARPFGGVVHWHSPDITLSPLSGVSAYTTTLEAGETYLVRCWLRNRGDLAVPSAKVELFLTDPTLGFDTRFATNLTLGRVPSAWVASGGSAAVEVRYTVPPAEAGHKCLFARAFSFSPLELPLDDHQLDPRLDRRVAQQNLNIVAPSEPFPFQLIHAPNARVRLALRPMEPEALLALRHPVLADVRPAREFPRRGWGRLAGIELIDAGGGEVALEPTHEGASFVASDPEGLDLEAQRELRDTVLDLLRAVDAGRAQMADHRDLLARFRAMNAEARRSALALNVTDLGLGRGEAVGVDLVALDESRRRPEAVGGITLVVVGG